VIYRSHAAIDYKPGVCINWSHPLSVDLVYAILSSYYEPYCVDLVTGSIVVTPKTKVTAHGVLSQGDQYEYPLYTPNFVLSTSSRPPSFTAITRVLLGPISPANSEFCVQKPTDHSYNHFRLANLNTYNVISATLVNDQIVLRGNTPISEGEFFTAAASYDKNTGEFKIYKNGVLDAQGSFTGNSLRNLPTYFFPVARPAGGVSDPFFEYSYFYSRALSAEEIAWLTQEPYCFLENKDFYYTIKVIGSDRDARHHQRKSKTSPHIVLRWF